MGWSLALSTGLLPGDLLSMPGPPHGAASDTHPMLAPHACATHKACQHKRSCKKAHSPVVSTLVRRLPGSGWGGACTLCSRLYCRMGAE